MTCAALLLEAATHSDIQIATALLALPLLAIMLCVASMRETLAEIKKLLEKRQ